MDTKEKATFVIAKKEVEPFLSKKLLNSYIEIENVGDVSRLLRNKYKNVDIFAEPGKDYKLYLTIKVSGLLTGGKLIYEIKDKGKSLQTKDPLDWIDRIEDYDALFY